MQQVALTMGTRAVAGAPRQWVMTRHGRHFGRLLACWIQRYRQRRALARLDERLLRDIGVTRAEAAAEAAKPFWRG